MDTEARKQFYEILGKYYKLFGYPHTCGWIDALLMLEPKKQGWSQKSISDRLSILFPDYPTSVPSINRALKINVTYGTVIREGNRKNGYSYRIAEGTELFERMFQNFIESGNLIILRLSNLLSKAKNDHQLQEAIQFQIFGIEAFNQILEFTISYGRGEPVDKFLDKKGMNT